MKYYVPLILTLLFTANASTAPLKIVTTFSILENLTREIGGEETDVSALIPRGNDPHDFSPSAKDLQRLKAADAVFLVGLGFETWFDTSAKAAGAKTPPVQLGATVDSIVSGGRTDPHVWLDFENARRMSLKIETTLIGLRPAKKEYFAGRGTAYRMLLTKLEEGFKKDFANIPTDAKVIVTAHEGFAYLARAFGLKFLYPTYVGHDHELSPKALAQFLKHVSERNLKSYFVVYGHPPAITHDLARDRGLTLAGTLYGDSLGPAGGEADTFLKMQEHNLRAILAHLRKLPQN